MKTSLARHIGNLQSYALHQDRERQVEIELQGFRNLLRDEAHRLTFDDQPSDFRAAQMKSASNE